MPGTDIKGVTTKNRLTYIEPNEFASYFNLKGSKVDSTELAWNPEDLAMSVDLQVIIPRREDKGQVSYLTHLNNVSIQNNNSSVLGRYVSYAGGVPVSDKPGSESFLTDNYTNISFQEVKEGKVIDQESLGINSIDINFDAHFFPIVTIKFTDVRGAALFMPTEYEFEQSVTGGKSSATSFFKALFHFPYPRFLLSVKGYYGNKVTFQLAVSDFRSSFKSDTGDYDVTVKFIGYVYGLYTDLPLNLVMASPYYNQEYWENKIKDGSFTYVGTNGEQGNGINTYIEYLINLEKKEVTGDALNNATLTADYLRKKTLVTSLNKIASLHRLMSIESVSVSNGLCSKRIFDNNTTFIWGRYGVNTPGFLFDTNTAQQYYDAIKEYLDAFSDDIDRQTLLDGNFYLKRLIDKGISLKDIEKDKANEHLTDFEYIPGDEISEYFSFKTPTDTGDTAGEKYIVSDSTDEFKKIVTDYNKFPFRENDNLCDGKITKSKETGAITNGLYIDYGTYVDKLTTSATTIQHELDVEQTKIAEDMATVYENVIGFAPTVENFYRMLFAHIDCFMDYFNRKVLGDITQHTEEHKRTVGYLSGGSSDKDASDLLACLDIPKTMTGGNDANTKKLNVFPFPGYFLNKQSANGTRMVAEYPGVSDYEKLREIREVDAVTSIITGLELFAAEFSKFVDTNETVGNNIFSPISILYNGQNPWEGIKLDGTNDADDLTKIIYFYACQLVAEKTVGINTDRTQNRINSTINSTYIDKQVNAFLNAGLNISSTLKELINIEKIKINTDSVNEKGGFLRENIVGEKNYRTLTFTTTTVDNDSIHIHNDGKNKNIPLKYDGTILTTPNNNLSEEQKSDYFAIPFTNGDTNTLFFITKNGKLEYKHEGLVTRNTDISLNNSELKNISSVLCETNLAKPYLDDIKTIPFGEYGVSLLESQLYGEEKKYWYYSKVEPKYTANNLEEVYSWFDNKPDNVIAKDECVLKNYIVPYNIKGRFKEKGYYKSNKSGVTDTLEAELDTIKTENVDEYTLNNLLDYYTNGNSNGQVSFVGRKISGTKGLFNKTDEHPAVNLFSGVKELVINGEKLDTDDDEYKPLLKSERCNGGETYAFATYFLATLSGNNGIHRIVEQINNKTTFKPVRKVDLLYLGGELYHQNMIQYGGGYQYGKNKLCELINEDGTLGGGLTNEYGKSTKPQLVDNEKMPDLLKDTLIQYFLDWCDNELFGSGMYDNLSATTEDNNEYVMLNGFASRENAKSYCHVIGYRKNSKCETWLRNLMYAYEFVLEFKAYETSDVPVYKSEIASFLSKISDKLNSKESIEAQEKKEKEEATRTLDQKRAVYYLLKNLYDKWLCGYSADEFTLLSPEKAMEARKKRFADVNFDKSEYGKIDRDNNNIPNEYSNFVYVDQYFNDISSTYMLNADEIAKVIKDVYTGNKNIDIYGFMSFMAEKNNLMLMALPVYNNMYNAKSIASVFSPNMLYDNHQYDGHNGIGTTYVVMYTSDVSHNPSLYEGYEYTRDYIDIADLRYNEGPEDLKYFGQTDSNQESSLKQLNYNVSAFAVSYGKQNQMYFKNVDVSMDNPKTTDESIQNILILSEGGGQGDTNQPVVIGQNIYSIYSNRSYTCTVEMLGCANIMPLMYFQLNNIPMFRGLYMIINVRHSIQAGKMTTVFTGVRTSRYSLPDVTSVVMNSNIFKKLEENKVWKDGKNLADCPKLPCEETTVDVNSPVNSGSHFKWIDLIQSDAADRNKLCNMPNKQEQANLQELDMVILEPFYKIWKEETGDELHINSVFRSDCVNRAVGGSSTSDHRHGRAADIRPTNKNLMKQFKNRFKCWLWTNQIQFKQCIDEKDGTAEWIHIAYQKDGNRREMLTYKGGGHYTNKHIISESDCQAN